MPRNLLIGLATLLALLGGGCSGDPGTGPADVRWDRYTCERCRMVLSDRSHAAQVRITEPEGRSRVLYFDDVGCALIWLEGKPFRDDSGVEIWTTDWRTGDWIDARSAFYLRGQVTPMEYGLGAQTEPAPDALSFDEAKRHVFQVERRYNVQGAHAPPAGRDG